MSQLLTYLNELDAELKVVVTHGLRILLILIAAGVLQGIASRLIRHLRVFLERRHDPLEAPGSADLTGHVDFPSLIAAAEEAGAAAFGPVTQGDFLRALGIVIDVTKMVVPETPVSQIAGPAFMPIFQAFLAAHPEYAKIPPKPAKDA